MSKIILSGYMASGKSTVGKILQKLTGRKMIDLDCYIESLTGQTISSLFDNKGELYFRKLEHQELQRLLKETDDSIICLGGGTPCYFDNHKILSSYPNWIYLKCSVNAIYQRVKNDNERPLLKSVTESELKEFIAKHLFERSYFYNQAPIILDTDNLSPSEIATRILELT